MKYYKKIDGLRFIAIMLVLTEHFAEFLGRIISAGRYGVDLFFVISGFLITTILLKPNDKSFKTNYLNFLGRRTLRIFPIYYITILLLWILNIEDIRSYMIYLVTYTANYARVTVGLPLAPVAHLWSLSIEEQFYLFWPFVILFLKRKMKLLTMIIVVIILVGYTQIIFHIFPSVTKYNYWGIFPRMSSLAMGGLGALFTKNRLIPDRLFTSRNLEILMFCILFTTLIIPLDVKYLLMTLCSLYFILKAVHYEFQIKSLNSLLSNKYIVYIGTISYGIYLFHYPIAYFLTKYIFDPLWLNIDFTALGWFKKIQSHSWIIKFPLYTFLSILIAAFSFKYIEQPILSLKNRWFPR